MAGYLASWGPKKFLVSPQKIVPFQGFKTSYALKEDSENDTSGTAPINTRGRELQTMSFSTMYLRAAGTDPQAQIKEWENLLGSSYPLYIRGQRFGPTKMMLTQVDVSDVEFSNTGLFLKANIAITLKEYDESNTTKVKSGTSGSVSRNAGSSSGGTSSAAAQAASKYAETVEKKKAEAMATTASKNDKATKKATLIERRLQA